MEINKLEVLSEIKGFLEGYNDELKYIVNVETDPSTNIAKCIIHEPELQPKIIDVRYEPFMYMKDLSKSNFYLYPNQPEDYIERKRIKYGITITELKTGNQKRLVNGYCYKITSRNSFNDIINYLRDGGMNPYEKLKDDEGKYVKNDRGKPIYLYRDNFFSVRPTEQFFISTQSRLYKGYEEYDDVHKLTFDIETTALRYEIGRVFAIGVMDNRGFEAALEVGKIDDDESEIKLIQKFFNLIDQLKPAIIQGFFSETFDFEFLLGRAKILGMDLTALPMGLKKGSTLNRRSNVSVKYGNTSDKYTATEMWGYSIIDILHAAKRTAAVNTEIKETGLKYIAKFEKIAKPNRTYIKGEDNSIGRYYYENKMFVIDDKNNYIQIPDLYQEISRNLYVLQANKESYDDENYEKLKKIYLKENPHFVDWFRKEALPKKYNEFISGKNLVKQYLLDDLWETEQVDKLYNQSSFMLVKLVPTTYQRICTMGTASVWNLLLTAWSYENDLAIPIPDEREKFSGGLARCYKSGYTERIIKIDYKSLYPMLQLTYDIFPMFDVTGVMKKILLYLTTTRNIYKYISNGDKLNNEETTLLREIDNEVHVKYVNNELSSNDISMAKVKQLPIKTLNNSLFGALGSDISFNWSDNVCAARITCNGRIHLRQAIWWFSKYGCIPLLAVTDGINFHFPEKTNIVINNKDVYEQEIEQPINEMWEYEGKKGIQALIAKFNKEEMRPPFMGVDDDGESISCLNLSRINYATNSLVKDKKTGEIKEKIKLTGNTIKSKIMPEYIEEFIDNGLKLILHGKGKEFVDYYYDYAEDIRYMRIPLKKIASKSKMKTTISAYKKRGKDKNGRKKAMQAHMELIIRHREEIAEELFEKHKHEFDLTKINEEKLSIDDKMKMVINYMPPEPELDSTIYYVNIGTKKSHGDAKKDTKGGKTILRSRIIDVNDLTNNPNMTGEYNYEKYLAAFNERLKTLLVGFDPETREKIPIKIGKDGHLIKSDFNPLKNELELKNFDLDDFDKSMYLEKLEVDFWNKTGYDPRLTWNGFKLHQNYRVYYEIYESALNYLNDLMTKKNKPRIKSINSEYQKGDLVLIKDNSEYHVGAYNGVFMEIIRENVKIPKSDIEIELDKKREEEEKKLLELKSSELTQVDERDRYLESQAKKRLEYFEEFKEKYGIPMNTTMETLFAEIKNSSDAFDDFINERELEIENENLAYGVDYNDNDS